MVRAFRKILSFTLILAYWAIAIILAVVVFNIAAEVIIAMGSTFIGAIILVLICLYLWNKR